MKKVGRVNRRSILIPIHRGLRGKYIFNKTRGLRKWPKRETIELRCNKLNPGRTETFEI